MRMSSSELSIYLSIFNTNKNMYFLLFSCKISFLYIICHFVFKLIKLFRYKKTPKINLTFSRFSSPYYVLYFKHWLLGWFNSFITTFVIMWLDHLIVEWYWDRFCCLMHVVIFEFSLIYGKNKWLIVLSIYKQFKRYPICNRFFIHQRLFLLFRGFYS